MYQTGEVRKQAEEAKKAEIKLAQLNSKVKNNILNKMADSLLSGMDTILEANALDMQNGREKGLKASFLDRLLLTDERIKAIAEGMRSVTVLADPIGEIVSGRTLPNGLTIAKVRVPLGVIGIIYEARPNVTADAIALCIKSGNAVVLKGAAKQ